MERKSNYRYGKSYFNSIPLSTALCPNYMYDHVHVIMDESNYNYMYFKAYTSLNYPLYLLNFVKFCVHVHVLLDIFSLLISLWFCCLFVCLCVYVCVSQSCLFLLLPDSLFSYSLFYIYIYCNSLFLFFIL